MSENDTSVIGVFNVDGSGMVGVMGKGNDDFIQLNRPAIVKSIAFPVPHPVSGEAVIAITVALKPFPISSINMMNSQMSAISYLEPEDELYKMYMSAMIDIDKQRKNMITQSSKHNSH